MKGYGKVGGPPKGGGPKGYSPTNGKFPGGATGSGAKATQQYKPADGGAHVKSKNGK